MQLEAALPTSADLTAADVLAPDEYLRVRRGWMARLQQTKRSRRVALGGRVTLVFETRETVLWQIHEVLHIENGWRPERIERELAAYRGLVAGPHQVCATLFVDGGPPGFAEELSRELDEGRGLGLRRGDARHPAALTDGPCFAACPVRYVRFDVAEPSSVAEWEWELYVRTPTFLAATRLEPTLCAQLATELI